MSNSLLDIREQKRHTIREKFIQFEDEMVNSIENNILNDNFEFKVTVPNKNDGYLILKHVAENCTNIIFYLNNLIGNSTINIDFENNLVIIRKQMISQAI